MKIILIIVLIVVLIIAITRYFINYCAVRGLLYYLAKEHSDVLDEEKATELICMAMKRTIKEFFGRV